MVHDYRNVCLYKGIGVNIMESIDQKHENSIDELMSRLGYAVYEAQDTEATLHLSLSVICGLSIAESIEHLKKIYEKKTLGQFLATVRTKIGLKEIFNDYMKDYIERRNFIVHNIFRTSTFNINSDEGRIKFNDFVFDFRQRNRKINLTFMALTDVWMQYISHEYKVGDSLKVHLGDRLFQEIQEEFVPELKNIFGASVNVNYT